MIRKLLLALLLLAFAPVAQGQTFPALSGRVVDAANLLDPAQEAALTQKLAALETQSGRQLVVATLPDLQGYDIADYGYRMGRAWGIGAKGKDDGAVLIVAPNDRKVRIEVGYGLEGILTDALSSRIIRGAITPRFKAGDYPGGIDAGVDEIATLLTLPPEEAAARAKAAEAEQGSGQSEGFPVMLIFWIIVLTMFVLPRILGRKKGRRYRGGSGPIILWGPGASSGGSSWGGGGGSGLGDIFSGGGGSFGGGGASGDW